MAAESKLDLSDHIQLLMLSGTFVLAVLEYYLLAVILLGCTVYNIYSTIRIPPKRCKDNSFSVAIIGCGFGGINMAIKLKEAGIKFTIYEKSRQLGGTWLDNVYPGCACDIASHLYSYSFFPKPDWSVAYPKQEEILQYLKDVVSHYGLKPHIKFNTEIECTSWNTENKIWNIKVKGGEDITSNILVSAVGTVRVPMIPGFKDASKFKGDIFHSAEWKKDFDTKGKVVGVIGTGATSVQIVPALKDKVKEMYVFQRTACWVPPRMGFTYPNFVKWIFEYFPFTMKIHRYLLFLENESRFWFIFTKNSLLGQLAQKVIETYMKMVVQHKQGLMPDYPMGCKRITPSDYYLQAFHHPKVELVTDGIQRLTETGIQTKDREYNLDAIIYATGFCPMKSINGFKCIGQSGITLKDQWGDTPNAYFGITIPNFPNFFVVNGPNVTLGHNSIVYMIECQVNYIMDCVRELIESGEMSIELKDYVHKTHMDWIYDSMKSRVFYSGCVNWYKNAKGINYVMWPSHLAKYWWMTKTCNPIDYYFK